MTTTPAAMELEALRAELAREVQVRRQLESLVEEKTRQFLLLIDELEERVAVRTKRFEDSLTQEREKNRRKSGLFSQLSHELRGHLQGLTGLSGLLLEGRVDPEDPETLKGLNQTAANLLELVHDVGDFSELEDGLVRPNPGGVRIAQFLKALVEELRPQVSDRDLDLRLELDPALEEGLSLDQALLRRVLNALLSNGIKFTENGHVCLRVKVLDGDDQAQVVHFGVEDSGSGIPPERLANIFEPVSRTTPILNRKAGSGLGLAIANRLVLAMGGSLEASSILEEGSTFSFALKLPISDLPRRNNAASTPLEMLVTEDDEIVRQLLTRILQSEGHRITLAANGSDAVHLCRLIEFDVILMDLEMPVLDGVEATRAIRSDSDGLNRNVPVIALTGRAFPTDRDQTREVGMFEHLVKPFSRSALIALLERVRPRTTVSAEPQPSHASPFENGAHRQQLSELSGRILVVDDERVCRKVLRNTLVAAGHAVLEASNGHHALKLIEENEVDVVILDVVMPGLDGFEVCARIKGHPEHRKVPVLLTTGLDVRSERIKGISAGADDFLVKPVDTRQLVLRVKGALRSKVLVDKLESSYAQLQRLEEHRDSMARMLVHDLRGPLSGILGYAQLLKLSNSLDDRDRGFAGFIEAMARVMKEMVSAILDVSRLEMDELSLEKSDSNIFNMVSREVEFLASLQHKPAIIESPRRDLMLHCDGELLRRVVANLLSNALSYNGEEHPIELSIHCDEVSVRIAIRDHGPGVPQEFREKIFDKFFQVEEGGQRRAYSSGLGLNFCKLVVEQHGGRIGTEPPQSGPGSVFWFEIPL